MTEPQKTFRVLAVDLGGAQVGHAVFVHDPAAGGEPRLVDASTWVIHDRNRTQSPGVRWLKLRRFLEAEIEANGPPDLVAYEEVRAHMSHVGGGNKGPKRVVMNVDAAHAYGAGEGILLAWCEENGLEVVSVTVGAVKNAATGKGGGPGTDKEAVLAAAIQRWGALHRFDGYDAADAAFIGWAALIDFGYAEDTPKTTKKAAAKKGKKKPADNATGDLFAAVDDPVESLFADAIDSI